MGLALGDLFPREDRNGQPRPRGGGLTVDKLARAKGLPADFVRQFCEPAGRAVRIVYRLANGERAPRQRLRTALKAKGGSRWEPARGPKPVPYGLERMGDARQAGYLVLVEGETDCWTLWYHGFPALGIPGASMAGTLAGEYLEGISRLYVWQEPDKGGEAFVRGVARRLAAIGWSGRALVVRITGVKDPNELHQRNPGAFAQAFREALERAEPLAFDEDEEDSAGPQEPQDEGPEPPGGRPGAEHLTDLGNA
ncbi:MAG: DNA primase, partial [Bacillota bacterium]